MQRARSRVLAGVSMVRARGSQRRFRKELLTADPQGLRERIIQRGHRAGLAGATRPIAPARAIVGTSLRLRNTRLLIQVKPPSPISLQMRAPSRRRAIRWPVRGPSSEGAFVRHTAPIDCEPPGRLNSRIEMALDARYGLGHVVLGDAGRVPCGACRAKACPGPIPRRHQEHAPLRSRKA